MVKIEVNLLKAGQLFHDGYGWLRRVISIRDNDIFVHAVRLSDYSLRSIDRVKIVEIHNPNNKVVRL